MAGIELRSPAFNDHAIIPPHYAYDGDNVNPALEWGDVPEGTAELELVMEDPDAPRGTFTHWVVTGIDPSARGIPEGTTPPGAVTGQNSAGQHSYAGPRPPAGEQHRYFFHLYAMRDHLGLGASTTGEQLHAAVKGKEIATGTLVGQFLSS